MAYRRADDELFGKYCYIDTPWIAGKHTIYRIIRSGVRSNSWCEVPINGLTKKVNHGEHTENIVFVVLDTLIDEDAEIMRVALKDVEIIGEAEQTENSSEKPNNCEYAENPSGDVWECGCFLDTYCEHQIYDRNPDGTINIVECGYEPKTEPTISKMEQVDEPKTQMKTQNSNLTFEKRKCIDCNFLTYMFGKTWCNIKCENPHDKVCDRFKPKGEPQTDCPWK